MDQAQLPTKVSGLGLPLTADIRHAANVSSLLYALTLVETLTATRRDQLLPLLCRPLNSLNSRTVLE